MDAVCPAGSHRGSLVLLLSLVRLPLFRPAEAGAVVNIESNTHYARKRTFIAVWIGLCLLLWISPGWGDALSEAHTACLNGEVSHGFTLLQKENLLEPGANASPEAWQVVADCQARAGNVQAQMAALERGRDAGALAGAHNLQVNFLQQIAETAFSLGEIDRALASLNDAIALAQQHQLYEQVPQLELAKGNMLARAGRFELASEQFQRVVVANDAVGDPATAIDARLNGARTLLRLQQSAAASQLLTEAGAALANEGDSAWKAKRLATLGELYYRLDEQLNTSANASRALAALEQANTMAKANQQPRTQSAALGYMGAIAERFGQWDEALAYSRAAASKAQEAEALDLLYQWQWQAGRVLEAKNLVEPALESYELAIDTLEVVRPALSNNAAVSFNAEIAPLYFDAADLRLRQHAELQEGAGQQQALGQVRDTVEQLRVAQIIDYFGDDCAVGSDEKIKADSLETNVAVIYPIIFDDRLEVLTTIGGTIHRHTVPVSKRELGKIAGDFRRGLVRRPTHRYREPGAGIGAVQLADSTGN